MPTSDELRAEFMTNGFRCVDPTVFVTDAGVEVVVVADTYRSLSDSDHPSPRTDRARRIYRVSAPQGAIDLIAGGFGLLNEYEVIALIGAEQFQAAE